MNGSYVSIRDVSSLEQLRIAIARFCEESENQMLELDSKLQSRIGNLKSLEPQFKRIIESAHDDLRSANNSLYSCESDSYEDEDGNTNYPDCDSEKEDIIDCRKRLELAENNYAIFKKEMAKLEISIAEYQKLKVKYKTLIQFEKEAATSSLKQLINGAEDYLSVSSPSNDGFSNGLGLTEAVAKIDPTMIFTATAAVTELMMIGVFSFFGLGGNLFSVSNTNKKGLVTSTFSEEGTEHICSELKIEKNDNGNFGKILSVNIPPSLQNEKIGKHLINNMEATCRANDCMEISGWANSDNIGFYQGLNYQMRNEIKETGAEIFKPLESNFLNLQQNAKSAFENLNNSDFIKGKNSGKQKINPLKVISPEEMYDDKFWQQHGENQNRYFDLIEKYDQCNQELLDGKHLDQIRKEDMWVANAHDVFHGSEPIRVLKSGDFYRIESNGRHRVAAAQLYFMQTGKTIPLIAEVIEKD